MPGIDTPVKPLRAMQSFGAPRATTNPYIQMLDSALADTEGLTHLNFSRLRALVGRYDVLHLHWPEAALGGRTRARATARRLYFQLLILRLRLSRTAVVRTVHNVELPADMTGWERRMLISVEREAALRIRLNEVTEVPDGESVLIPHGHYRDWFADAPRVDPVPGRIAFVGLIRRYKGVETLLSAFQDTVTAHPELSLLVAGNPSTSALAEHVEKAAQADPRISAELSYVSEDEYAQHIQSAELVVLPYRFMHNSGSALAALSLDRPVLVPRNHVNEALAAEVGAGWVYTFDGDLDPSQLLTAMDALRSAPPSSPPSLDQRDWDDVGESHLRAYRIATEAKGNRRNTHPGSA